MITRSLGWRFSHRLALDGIAAAKNLSGIFAISIVAAVAHADITSDLQVRYRMDDISSTSVPDSSGNNRTATLTGSAVPSTDGRFRDAVDLNGTTAYIVCPNLDDTDEAAELTVSFWVNTDSRNDDEALCAKRKDINNIFVISLGATGAGDDNDIAVAVVKEGELSYRYTDSDVLTNSTWVHVAVVYDGSQGTAANRCKVYIDGQFVSTSAGGDPFPDTLPDGSSDPWWIGWREDEAATPIDGRIDEFHLYTRALTAPEVEQLYEWYADGIFSTDFNGSTSRLQNNGADILSSSQQVTVCCWINPDTRGQNNTGYVITLDEADGNASFVVRHNSSTDVLSITKGAGGGGGTDGAWTIDIDDEVWNAVAIRLDFSGDNAPTARVNYLATTVSGSGQASIQDQPAHGYCVGNRDAVDRTWDGRIAHVQVFNRILSWTETDAALRAPGSVPNGLRLWLGMTHVEDVADYSGNVFHGTRVNTNTGSDSPPYDNLFNFGPVDVTLGPIVIPSNGSEPSIGVRGLGTRTKLKASRSLYSGDRFVTTESWGSTSTVVEPTVRDVYLDGNQGFSARPSGSDPAICHAIAIDGDAGEVAGCKVFDFAGDGIGVNNTMAEAPPLARMPRVRDNIIALCYTGIRAGAVDTQVTGNRVANVRDYSLHVPVDAGNVQSDGNHYFGASTAIKVEAGGPFRSVNDTFSDAAYGFDNALDSLGSQIDGGLTQRCWIRNIICRAQTSITNTTVRVSQVDEDHSEIIGVEWPRDGSGNAERSSFIGGVIYTSIDAFPMKMTYGPSTAGMKIDAYSTEVRTTIIGATGTGDERGIWVPSAIQGGSFHINVAGFGDSGDCAVSIDTEDIKGTTWVIECTEGDNAVDIPAGWDSSNSFTIIKHFAEVPMMMIPARTEKTVLTPGESY